MYPQVNSDGLWPETQRMVHIDCIQDTAKAVQLLVAAALRQGKYRATLDITFAKQSLAAQIARAVTDSTGGLRGDCPVIAAASKIANGDASNLDAYYDAISILILRELDPAARLENAVARGRTH